MSTFVILYHKDDREWVSYLTTRILNMKKLNIELASVELSTCNINHRDNGAVIRGARVTALLCTQSLLSFLAESELDMRSVLNNRYRTILLYVGCFDEDFVGAMDKEGRSLADRFEDFGRLTKMAILAGQEQKNCIDFLKKVAIMFDQLLFGFVIDEVVSGENSVVTIIFDEEPADPATLKLSVRSEYEGSSYSVAIKWHNLFTCSFILPENMSGELTIEFQRGRSPCGARTLNVSPHSSSAQNQYHELYLCLLQTLVEQMKKSSSWAPKDVDRHFREALATPDIPCSVHENLFSSFRCTPSLSENSQFEHPTLLHFAAEHGLTSSTKFLLDLPNAILACEVKNRHGKTPFEVARGRRLSDIIRAFEAQQRLVNFAETVFKSAYDFENDIGEEHYLAMASSGSPTGDTENQPKYATLGEEIYDAPTIIIRPVKVQDHLVDFGRQLFDKIKTNDILPSEAEQLMALEKATLIDKESSPKASCAELVSPRPAVVQKSHSIKKNLTKIADFIQILARSPKKKEAPSNYMISIPTPQMTNSETVACP